MFVRVISTFAFTKDHYSVHIGYQGEQNYTKIVLKHVFLNNTFTLCTVGLLDKNCSKKLHVKKKKVAI